MKKLITILFIFALLLNGFTIAAQTYYVSPTGNDLNTGSLNYPFLTIQKALSLAAPGVTIYLRSGVYNISATLKTVASGNAANPVRLWAYQDEAVILDFSSEPYVSASRGIELSQNYWYLKGLTIRNAGDNGIYIGGNNNIVENCQLYGNKDTGLQISNGASNNYIHNCDAFGNNDPATGGQNADGIDVKLDAGPGNVLRGCRAFDNADDGYDCYQTSYRVVFDSCWAFHNGYNLWNIPNFTGNGNGFKLGGNFVPGPHRVTNCISFDNTVKGFDQNNNTAGVTIYNCTAFRNGTYNFAFTRIPTSGQDTFKNNLSWLSNGVSLETSSLQQKNNWNTTIAVNAASFMSIDTSFARVQRYSDGTIPSTTFLRLAAGSPLIDAGIAVGLPFLGASPDLGAFESGSDLFSVNLLSLSASAVQKIVTLHWIISSEFQNSGWTIQRLSTINGVSSQWQDMGFKGSLGNTARPRTYAYTDSTIINFGTYQYRLKQISLSGTVVYSNIVSINIIGASTGALATALSIFPNPFSISATVQVQIPVSERITVSVYSSSGHLMKYLLNNWYIVTPGVYSLPLNGILAAGEYTVQLFTEDGTRIIKKAVKVSQ